MATLHDNEVRLRDQLAGPTEHEIDALIPDLTDVDIHEHFPELREEGERPRAATRVRWLGWLTALLVVAVAGVIAVVLLARGGDGGSRFPEDGPWSNSLNVPVIDAQRLPEDGPWSNSLNVPVIQPAGITAAELAALEDAITPQRVVVELPGGTSLNVPAIPMSATDLAALEDAITPASGPAVPGVTAAEFAALEDAITPASLGLPTPTDGPGSNSLNLP